MKFKIYLISVGLFSIIFLLRAAFAQEKAAKKQNELVVNKMAVGDTNKDGKIDAADLPADNGGLKVAGKVEAGGQIKTDAGVCIKGACRENWPVLKCAEYDLRPAEETGDYYCNGLGKSCFGVFIGSGTSYYNECSTATKVPHKTRCCWVE